MSCRQRILCKREQRRIWKFWKGVWMIKGRIKRKMKMLGRGWHEPKQTAREQDILLWTEKGRPVPKGSQKACLRPCVTHFLLQNNILVHNLRGNAALNRFCLVHIITGHSLLFLCANLHTKPPWLDQFFFFFFTTISSQNLIHKLY